MSNQFRENTFLLRRYVCVWTDFHFLYSIIILWTRLFINLININKYWLLNHNFKNIFSEEISIKYRNISENYFLFLRTGEMFFPSFDSNTVINTIKSSTGTPNSQKIFQEFFDTARSYEYCHFTDNVCFVFIVSFTNDIF